MRREIVPATLAVLACVCLVAGGCRTQGVLPEEAAEAGTTVGVREFYRNGRPGVALDVQASERTFDSGSGVPLTPTLVLTAAHVAEDPLVRINGVRAEGVVVASGRYPDDPDDDWALVRVSPPLADAPSVMIAGGVEIGDRVRLIGWPRLEKSRRLVLARADGVVTERLTDSRGRPIGVVEVESRAWGGMSGGPVLNEGGELVGTIMYVQARWRLLGRARYFVGVRLVPHEVRAIVEVEKQEPAQNPDVVVSE